MTSSTNTKKFALAQRWFGALGITGLVIWLTWPSSESGMDAFMMSNADGKSRFYITTFSILEMPPTHSFQEWLSWGWRQCWRRYGKPNPAACFFPPVAVQPCSIAGSLNQCMEATGTRYLIAVEIAGVVEFGTTKTLNGAQWAAAFEHAIEKSDPVICYDYSKKHEFQDTLLLIRERPGLVKIVPRSKLAEYQKAGL